MESHMCPSVEPSAAVISHVGETVREVFPGLSERQVAEVVRVCGADVDRCLQHILDRPLLFLSPPPPPQQAQHDIDHGHSHPDGESRRPPLPSPSRKPVTSAAASSTSSSSLSSNEKAGVEEQEEGESRRSKYETLTPAEDRRRRHEFADLNNMFADIMSGAQTGEVIFKGQFKGAKSKVISSAASSQQEDGGEENREDEGEEEDADLVLARALQAIEDDAYRTMKRREEEDERYARELAQSEHGGEPTPTDHAQTPTERGTRRRRLLISSSEGSQEAPDSSSVDAGETQPPSKGWRELVRQDSLTERDRRLALQLIADEEREKRKREEEDEALARALSGDGAKDVTTKRRRIDAEGAETSDMTSDELIVRLLQEEEEAEKARQAKRAKKEEAMSRKLIEKLMRVEKEMEHDEWVKSELAQIEAREAEESMATGKKKKKAGKKWPGFGFGWGDKERMKAKLKPAIAGDSDWKSTRFFMDTQVLEGFLHSCASSHGVVTITNVMKSDLISRFDRKWSEFKATYGSNAAESQTTLAFHGTRGSLIPSITNKGLLVPGTAPGVAHVTDSGWYGCGIYLSPNPSVAEGYAADGKMLVCAVLMGRTYHCPDLMEGEGCRLGYDSHTSPCGEELVLFDAAQVLPCYLINFSSE